MCIRDRLQGDQIDVGISGFTYDSKRKVEWSDPYLGSSQVAVIPKEDVYKRQLVYYE